MSNSPSPKPAIHWHALILLAVFNSPISFAAGDAPIEKPITVALATTKPFQPGVAIDWKNKRVFVDAHVVLRKGPLEFAACFGGKEHESILRIDATAEHIFMALGLIGIEPGTASQWIEEKEEFSDPTGPLVDITVQVNDQTEPVALYSWILNAETLRPTIARPWIYSGSRRLDDGTLLCQRSGAALALVDFPDNFFSPMRRYGSGDASLWAFANEKAIPPKDTKVQLIFTAAQPRAYKFRVDRNGLLFVNDQLTEIGEVAALLTIAAKLQPNETIKLQHAADSLKTDRKRIESAFKALRVPRDRWEWKQINNNASKSQ